MVLWFNKILALENDDVRRKHERVVFRPWRGAPKASFTSFAPAFGVVAVAAGDVIRQCVHGFAWLCCSSPGNAARGSIGLFAELNDIVMHHWRAGAVVIHACFTTPLRAAH